MARYWELPSRSPCQERLEVFVASEKEEFGSTVTWCEKEEAVHKIAVLTGSKDLLVEKRNHVVQIIEIKQ
jgi:hypothetical protein